MRWAAKRDDSEAGIVKALEAHGWTVFRLSDKGVPDLLAVKDGRAVPFECKSNGGTLTPAQEAAFERWLRAGMPVHVVHTPEEALAAIGALGQAMLHEACDAVAGAAEKRLNALEHQRRETAAVVPPPRSARKDAKALATSASYPAKACECGHSKGAHMDGTGPCMGAAVGCRKGCAGYRVVP